MALTTSQQEAVDSQGNLLLFAGPGSGKTSTAIEKAFSILSDGKRSLIMTTFTNAAADEIRERLRRRFTLSGAALPETRVEVSSLDSLAWRHLRSCMRRHNRQLRLLSPKMVGPMLRGLMTDLGKDEADEISAWFERYQSALDRTPLMEQMREKCPPAIAVIASYYERLKVLGQVDLATAKRSVALGFNSAELPPFAATDLIVDEAQDCDALQLSMALSSAKVGIRTTLIADDDQTIYAWRGATGYEGLMSFVRGTDAKIVRLGENFRSHEEIVARSTRLIAFNNPHRVDKGQRSTKGLGGSARVHFFGNRQQEFEWIASEIARRSSDSESGNFAVISRRNIELDDIEDALTACGVVYARDGLSLWDRDEVIACLSFLKHAASADVSSLGVALAYASLPDSATREALDVAKDGWEATVADPTVANLGSKILRLRASLKAGESTVFIVEGIAAYIGLMREVGRVRPNKAAERRLDVVASVVGRMPGTVAARLELLLRSKRRQESDARVRLLTMHASKGLEFDTVFVAGADEREEHQTESEAPFERRVMYVAMSRPRRHLEVTFGGKLPRFIMEAGFRWSDVIQHKPPV